MGLEAKCTARFGRESGIGKALLETHEILFRGGDLRFAIRLSEVTEVVVDADDLVLSLANGSARLALGAAIAKKWADKIKSPKSRLDKLGVKAGARVLVQGEIADDLLAEIRERAGNVTTSATGPGDRE